MSTGTFLRESIRGRALTCAALVGTMVTMTGAAAQAGSPSAGPDRNKAALLQEAPITIELSESIFSEDESREEVSVKARWVVQPDGHWTRTLVGSNGFHEEASGILDHGRNGRLQELAFSPAATKAAKYSPLDMGCPANKISIREDIGSTRLAVENMCMGSDEGHTPEWSDDQVAAWRTMEEIGGLAMALDAPHSMLSLAKGAHVHAR